MSVGEVNIARENNGDLSATLASIYLDGIVPLAI
jgi:hypothetical protein